MTTIELTMIVYGLEPAPEDEMDDEEELAVIKNQRTFR